MAGIRLVGVDGCKAGWIAVSNPPFSPDCHHRPLIPDVAIFSEFSILLDFFPARSVIAVDMPIGLPEKTSKGGRGPEQAIRPMLGARQSSVFSIPSRAAVYASDYRQACRIALETSDPPRKVSRQAFHLFPKIREIDEVAAMRGGAGIFEVHPELAFWRLNGNQSMPSPKKIKGRINPAGMEERRRLLASTGLDESFLTSHPPKGAAADDFLDACACLMIAARLLHGLAKPFPSQYLKDVKGLRIAIWA